MPEYLAPGVYIEEIEIGGKPIEGVSTSTAGFLGVTERGPTDPKLVTGFEQFSRLYGGFIENSYMAYAVDGFFSNGGKRCFIGRIVGKEPKPAALEVPASKGNSPETKDKKKKEKASELTTPTDIMGPTTPTDITGGPPTDSTIGSNPNEKAFTVKAIGPGEWGNRVAIKIEGSRINPASFKMAVVYFKKEPPGFEDERKEEQDRKFKSTLKAVVDPTDPDRAKRLDIRRMEPSVVEVYDSLSANPASSDFYEKRINNISSLIKVSKTGDGSPMAGIGFLNGGSDGSKVELGDYRGISKDTNGRREKTGLLAFGDVDEISILCAPDEDSIPGLTDALIEHCELLKDRFAIIQAPQSAGPIGELRPPTDSKYAAYYYPWIKVMDPITNMPKFIPLGGHVAGIYARSDTERGVHKAPANEVVRGAIELQFPISKGEQDLLNPRGVNCIRAFPGRGIRVWGARTISSDPIWKYVNVRRLFLYLEESIEEGTQWVVFEPNDHRLWARVKQSVTDFLTRVWKDGALMGRTVEEAFFVKCDETTMTPDDIDNGRLIVLIGVAPVKPAEFVIFRIAQWRSGSEIIE